MAVKHDYKCPTHGYFESTKAQCPMKGCQDEVFIVFLQAPATISPKTKFTDKSTKQLAIEFGMSDIKTTREGEHQSGYLTRHNKFSEKEYAEAEKYATRKRGLASYGKSKMFIDQQCSFRDKNKASQASKKSAKKPVTDGKGTMRKFHTNEQVDIFLNENPTWRRDVLRRKRNQYR